MLTLETIYQAAFALKNVNYNRPYNFAALINCNRHGCSCFGDDSFSA